MESNFYIDIVQSYTYLGTLISLTRNFSLVFDKAILIKCFVSHRPTDPFFWKSKKKFQNHL